MIINGDLYLKETNVESLGELTNVNGRLSLWNCEKLKDLGKLKTVKEKINIYNTSITEEYILKKKKQLYGKIF